jgi:[CysO sulfur-carrier protein]-S-L-cysteine hydrolase
MIPKAIYDEMLAHTHSEYPNECCGLLAGKEGQVTKLYRMTNTHHSPVSYFMDPKEQFTVFKDIRTEGSELLAIYHSHPHTVAYPSSTDIGLAYYPEALYIIISLENRDRPLVNAFRIVDGKITQETFKVI